MADRTGRKTHTFGDDVKSHNNSSNKPKDKSSQSLLDKKPKTLTHLLNEGPSSSRAKPKRSSAAETRFQLERLALGGNHPNRTRLAVLKAEFPRMDARLIENIICYVNRLPKFGRDDIDEVIFNAQLAQHFGLKDKFMLSRIFAAFISDRSTSQSFLSYCRLMCVFLSDDIGHKVNYAFEVYNIKGDGLLKKWELRVMLMNATELVDDEDDRDDNFNFLLNLVMEMFDFNNDGEIDRWEFQSMVKQNNLMLECLGQCLPSPQRIDAFLEKVGPHNSKVEVMAIFRHERRQSLKTVEDRTRGIQKYYQVQLDFELWKDL